VPPLLGKGFTKTNEPRIALIVTAIIAEISILLGGLNLIAPVITMFFLTTYGMVNTVAGLEHLVSNPSYRPAFKVHWLWSILGGLGCALAMFLINPWATVGATVIVVGIYSLLTRVRFRKVWGDMRSGLWFSLTRFGFLRFQSSQQHLRNWRPIVLVLSGNPKSRLTLVNFADWIEARRGLLLLAQIVIGSYDNLVPRHKKLQEALQTFIREHRLPAVAKTVIANDFESGVLTLLQVAGLGEFRPNTVLVGWSEDGFRQADFGRAIRRVLELEKNLLVFSATKSTTPLNRVIDVWWYAKDNGSLMLTLAYLLRSTLPWNRHKIRILRIISDPAGIEKAKQGTQGLIENFNIGAEVQVIVSQDPPLEVIARTSKRSELCFLGLSAASLEDSQSPLTRYAPLVSELEGNVVLTKSWHDLRL
jgi:hypothetical protein